MIDFINSHINGNPYKLEKNFSSELKYQLNGLEKILSLAEGYRISRDFIKEQNKKEIAFLEKEIKKHKENSTENKDSMMNLIIEKC